MSNDGKTEPTDPFTKMATNPKILGLAGGVLFCGGILASVLAGFSIKDVNADRINMVLSAAVLLSFGYPLSLYVQSLKKIGELEKRITELEQKTKANP
jgi:hypothetical protein